MRIAASIGLCIGVVGWAGWAMPAITGFPTPVRGWETRPGVVRGDGVSTFRIEVDTNGAVAGVRLTDVVPCLTPSDDASRVLRDDGAGGDRVAGDFVFTSVPLRIAC